MAISQGMSMAGRSWKREGTDSFQWKWSCNNTLISYTRTWPSELREYIFVVLSVWYSVCGSLLQWPQENNTQLLLLKPNKDCLTTPISIQTTLSTYHIPEMYQACGSKGVPQASCNTPNVSLDPVRHLYSDTSPTGGRSCFFYLPWALTHRRSL